MNLTDFYVLKIQQFCLVLFRVTGILVIAPIFGNKQIGTRMKAGFAFFISLALFPVTRVGLISIQENWGSFTIDIGRELMVGIIIGYCASILFAAIQLGGEVVARQMGLGIARLIDPLTGDEGSPVIHLQGIVATLLFLAVNGHHWLIIALDKSFQFAPAGDVTFGSTIPNKLVEMVGHVFSVGIRIAAPAFVLLITVTILMGVVARAVSGMNVLIVGMPLKIGLGFIGLILSVPTFGFVFKRFFTLIQKDVMYLLHAM